MGLVNLGSEQEVVFLRKMPKYTTYIVKLILIFLGGSSVVVQWVTGWPTNPAIPGSISAGDAEIF